MKYRNLRIAWSVAWVLICLMLDGDVADPIYWLVVLLLGLMAAVPWMGLPNNFSLRTLLIGMTVLAALLGLVVWAAR